ncbi:unnamed protein product [Rodentolepis nana]|uniref:Vacuolar protein sorting-associated protein 18 homolog n=1 Tax=Rodentolepis nana TaxID=102285 RepID=A0A0R3TQ96_RODNA|nr:unnamed protein product [Rodentolepis nana]
MAVRVPAESGEFFSKDNIFSLKPVPWFRPSAHITHVVVCSNIIFAATTSNRLIIAGVLDRSYFAEVGIPSTSDDRVHNLFVDYRGFHIIISMQSGVNFYTTRKSKKFKQIQKAKDILIDSVAWNQYHESDTTTQEILIGTNDGIIFETMLSTYDEILSSSSGTVIWKEMIRLDSSITGLAVIRYPPGSSFVPVGEPQLCAIFASTSGRLYQFFGRIQSSDLVSATKYINPQSAVTALREGYIPGFFAPIFASYAENPSGAKCIEFPVSFGYSDLKVYQKKNDEVPSQFAWMTSSGIYFGKLDAKRLLDPELLSNAANSTSPLRISLANEAKLIKYPPMDPGSVSLPICISLSEFHVIVSYGDRVKAINVLDDQTIFVQSTRDVLGASHAMGACRDPAGGAIWLYSGSVLCKLCAEQEDLRVWRILLDKQKFSEARKHCKLPEQLNEVNAQEAELCFSRGDYARSAELFAETSTPFEEVALRFSQISPLTGNFHTEGGGGNFATGIALTEDYEVVEESDCVQACNDEDEEGEGVKKSPSKKPSLTPLNPLSVNFHLPTSCAPLKIFLRAKKRSLEAEGKDKQVAIIVLWLIELLLGEISLCSDKHEKADQPAAAIQEQLNNVRNEFRALVTSCKVLSMLPQCKDVIYNLLINHGNSDDFIFFAKTNGDHVFELVVHYSDMNRKFFVIDYDRLIDYYMSRGEYTEALFVFTTHPSCASKLYQYSVQLAPTEPKMLVDAWIRAGQRLSCSRLLPSILLLPPHEAVRYLEFSIDQLQCKEQAIHHQLIFLYADFTDSTADTRLLTYLKKYTSSDLSEVFAEALGDVGDSTHAVSKTLSSAYSTVGPNLSYDPGFAIRIAMEKGCLRSTVFLLQSLKLFSQAIDETLSKNDIDLAKEIVNSNMLDIDTQRALWLRIARHVITGNSSLEEATALLNESSLLRLEDVFPLFPDFVTIDEFREVICDSLDAYSAQIEQLKAEMRATVESTNEIRTKLSEMKTHYEIIPENARCSLCLQALALRTFYVFPCGHFFHTDCLLNQIRSSLLPQDASRLAELYSKSETDPSAIQKFRSEFDELVASDCALCGKIAIESCNRLFYSNAEDYEKEQRIWLFS